MEAKTFACALVLAVTLMIRRVVEERICSDGRAQSTEEFLNTMFRGRKENDEQRKD